VHGWCQTQRSIIRRINICFSERKNTIFISHRLGSTKLADEIIVISEGKAAEIGTFDELMAKGGIYAEMFASQAEWYKEDDGEKKESGVEVCA